MKGRAQKIRLGVFIMFSSLLLLILIGFFTARRLFEKTDIYYVAYRDVSVSGLEAGSPVKFMGINVGSISSIYIDPDDVNQIIVRLSLKEGTPVKVDATADIVSMGITGLKTIEIRGGTNEADFLKEEQFIRQGTSLVEDISGQAEVIAYKVEEVLNNILDFTKPQNLERFTEAVENISRLSDNAQKSFDLITAVVAENRQDLRQSILFANSLTGRLDSTALDFMAASSRINELMQGDTIGEILGNIRDISVTLRDTDLNGLIENLAVTAAQTQQMLIKIDGDIDRGSKDLGDNLMLLKYTLENLQEASRKINTDPSVLIRGQRARDIPDRRLQ
ncbi:MAG: MCE family protein [Bacteroidetes bacterium]|nr:MAG: MCE family protein [Bacteroidota bacterium]